MPNLHKGACTMNLRLLWALCAQFILASLFSFTLVTSQWWIVFVILFAFVALFWGVNEVPDYEGPVVTVTRKWRVAAILLMSCQIVLVTTGACQLLLGDGFLVAPCSFFYLVALIALMYVVDQGSETRVVSLGFCPGCPLLSESALIHEIRRNLYGIGVLIVATPSIITRWIARWAIMIVIAIMGMALLLAIALGQLLIAGVLILFIWLGVVFQLNRLPLISVSNWPE
jgi:hypothetical protein